MRNWVIGTMIFMSVIFTLGISKVNAKNYDINDVNLSGISSLQYYSSNYSLAYSKDSGTNNDKLYLVFWNTNLGRLELATGSSYENEVCLEQGYCFFRFWANISGVTTTRYKAYYTSIDNGNTWTLGSVNNFNLSLQGKNYMLKTTVNLYGYTNSTKDDLYFSSGYEYVSEFPVDLIITQTRLDSFSTILNITLDDVGGRVLGGNVYYSYNNSEFYPLDIDEAGEISTLPVYTNGNVYFKVVDSSDNVILEKTFNVTGMPSISGYFIYEIPKGNNQIYISNLGNNATGNFYIPFTMKGFSEDFTYLDSNGDFIGSQIFDFTSFEDLGVDTVSGADLGLVTVSYDFSSLSNVKIISFNHNSNDNLIIWIPSSFYLDYVDIDNQSNYHCEGDSNINDSINLAKCYLKFDYNDNGTITQIEDTTNDASDLGNSEYFNQVVQVTKFNMPILKGVTQDFTLFVNSLDTNLRYGFFFIFATFFIVAIMKLSKL